MTGPARARRRQLPCTANPRIVAAVQRKCSRESSSTCIARAAASWSVSPDPPLPAAAPAEAASSMPTHRDASVSFSMRPLTAQPMRLSVRPIHGSYGIASDACIQQLPAVARLKSESSKEAARRPCTVCVAVCPAQRLRSYIRCAQLPSARLHYQALQRGCAAGCSGSRQCTAPSACSRSCWAAAGSAPSASSRSCWVAAGSARSASSRSCWAAAGGARRSQTRARRQP